MGPIYSASKFGLRGFAQALREECAPAGVQVSLIQPGMVRKPFYDSLSFAPDEEDSCAICPEDVAEAIHLLFSLHQRTVYEELLLTPLRKQIHKKNG